MNNIDISHNRPVTHSVQLVENTNKGIKITLLDSSYLHLHASGNKLFKLSPNLDYAIAHGFTQVLSFGGAFSNHIHALALYGKSKGLQTHGVIRGEPEYANNPTLKDALQQGMRLIFVDRKTYRLRNDPDYLRELADQYPQTFIIPEGGSNLLAVKGCEQLAELVLNTTPQTVDMVAVPCGTGGTLAGLVSGFKQSRIQLVLGFTVVRDSRIPTVIKTLLDAKKHADYQLIAADYGGYAKFDSALLDFILKWLNETGVLLDPVYTSKMCQKLIEMIKNNQIEQGKHICVIHTGGLQAWMGMRDKVVKLRGEEAWRQIERALPQL